MRRDHRSPRLRGLLFALALAAPSVFAEPAPGDGPATGLQLAPCPDGEGLLCGTLEVFEDRHRRQGRKIPLHVVVMPSRQGRPGDARSSDGQVGDGQVGDGQVGDDQVSDGHAPSERALFLLAGGPGVAATRWGPGFVDQVLQDVREQWDVVLVDQRGTGESNPLHCPLYDLDDPQSLWGDLLPEAAVRRCRRSLEERADLRFYGTAIAVDDLDDVRAALGYSEIDLYGSSYGSQVALVYLRRHPQRVRSAVLQGVAPTTARGLEEIPQAAQTALERLIELCRDDELCHAAYPELEQVLAAVFERLRAGPLQVDVTPPGSEEAVTLELTYDNFALVLRGLLHHAPAAAAIPRIVHAAAAGDFESFAGPGFGYRRSIAGSIAFGQFLSVFCEEQVRRADLEAAAAAAESSFAGGYWTAQLVRACGLWPPGTVPPGYGQPVRSRTPTLLIAGGLDPATPPHWARAVASNLPRSRLLEVPYASHSFAGMAGCVDRAVVAFLESGSVHGLDTSCIDELEPAAFDLP